MNKIYEKLNVGHDYIGATVAVPNCNDLGVFFLMLKERETTNWEMLSVTKKGNICIQ